MNVEKAKAWQVELRDLEIKTPRRKLKPVFKQSVNDAGVVFALQRNKKARARDPDVTSCLR